MLKSAMQTKQSLTEPNSKVFLRPIFDGEILLLAYLVLLLSASESSVVNLGKVISRRLLFFREIIKNYVETW